MIHSCVFCLVIVFHESLVCPEQLNYLLFFRKIIQVLQILWFSSIFVYLNPFKQWLYDFDESSVMVANESLSYPRCEKMDLKINNIILNTSFGLQP